MKHKPSYYDHCLSEMKEMFSIPEELFFELNDAFFEIAAQQIELLRVALLQKDVQQLILHSHTLKGSSISLRHETISQLAAQMERHAKEGSAFNYAKAIYALSEEIARLRGEYLRWKQNTANKPTNAD
ncbi:MAG TPA: Hpt domain-containing protein [Sulfuricurvum sp.]|nr:Hpt domain-containing protein [Sulfuricurvum sp.]